MMLRSGASRQTDDVIDGLSRRVSTLFADARNSRASDERGRHAVAGPSPWIAERLVEYVDAGCDGFVVYLGHDIARLDERVQQFAEEVWPDVTRSAPP
jgi:hypothetical protein